MLVLDLIRLAGQCPSTFDGLESRSRIRVPFALPVTPPRNALASHDSRLLPSYLGSHRFAHPGTDGRDPGAIDLHCNGALQQSDGDHHLIRIASAQENPFRVSKWSIVDTHALAFF